MNIWLYVSFFVIWVFKDIYLNHRFDNKYVDITFELFFLSSIAVLLIFSASDGLVTLAGATSIVVIGLFFELRELNATKEDE